MSASPDRQPVGQNGVELAQYDYEEDGYRSYEIYQRERVGQSTEKINGLDLASSEYARDPYPALAILRENYPCYRDWINNCYWITRYDDVTSLFTDDANFESRSKLWRYGLEGYGRDLGEDLHVRSVWTAAMDAQAASVAERLLAGLDRHRADLATQFAAPYPIHLLAAALGLPEADIDTFASRYWRAQQGVNWNPTARADGQQAIRQLSAYFEPLLKTRSRGDGEDLISAVARVGGSPKDLAITLLEADHETLHGSIANLWMQLLTHPDAFATLKHDRRLIKIAYLEAQRHSPPVLVAERYARHEVERFGRLLPRGAQMRLSALAANRDPRLFRDADDFIADRRDLCHREARGQYRADGLPTAISFGLGPPSRHPAIPEDRPRSLYALTRDVAVLASEIVIAHAPRIRLAEGAEPTLRSLQIGGTYTCWALPAQLD
jgi:pulcherriminic acid synthase